MRIKGGFNTKRSDRQKEILPTGSARAFLPRIKSIVCRAGKVAVKAAGFQPKPDLEGQAGELAMFGAELGDGFGYALRTEFKFDSLAMERLDRPQPGHSRVGPELLHPQAEHVGYGGNPIRDLGLVRAEGGIALFIGRIVALSKTP